MKHPSLETPPAPNQPTPRQPHPVPCLHFTLAGFAPLFPGHTCTKEVDQQMLNVCNKNSSSTVATRPGHVAGGGSVCDQM